MKSRQILFIIWTALLSSSLMYAVVGYVAGPQGPAPDSAKLMIQVMGLFALLNLGASYLLRPMIASAASFQSYMIVRWAMCETPALFGLVLRFLGASVEVMGGFIAAGLIALLITAPSQAELDTYESFRKN